MSDMPELKTRNMGKLVETIAGTHQQIAAGILERANQHAEYLKSRDAELNATARLQGKA